IQFFAIYCPAPVSYENRFEAVLQLVDIFFIDFYFFANTIVSYTAYLFFSFGYVIVMMVLFICNLLFGIAVTIFTNTFKTFSNKFLETAVV
ncbi:hypothetical protein MMK25_30785, partial [Bacillus cereus]|nr:hypothetical protein [Bacillus cereus]